MANNSPSTPSASGILLPQEGHQIPAAVLRDLPCYTILVHGVNDVGECYSAFEQGLCKGLNERLDRRDLVHAGYSVPTEKDLQGVHPSPDDVYYRRQSNPGAWSPVIPFYWGFREEEKVINKEARHGEWMDRHGNRLDKHGSKGGGAFANATNGIPDVFGPGFKQYNTGVNQDKLAFDPTHPLLNAPDRSYNVLAAKRLAMLVTIIRTRHAENGLPEPAINIIAHSQGNMVTLLAHAILAVEHKRGADCFIMCNPTYCLRGLDDAMAKLAENGQSFQTLEARFRTFRNILDYLTGNPDNAPSFEELSTKIRESHGLAGAHWRQSAIVQGQPRAYTDRDNRGRVFLYFCPEDRTVALQNIQGVGWCGVQDEYLKQLPPRFKQRVWTMKWRDNKPYPVGQAPYSHPLCLKDEDFWGWAAGDGPRSKVEENTWRWISADPLPVVFEPRLRRGDLNEREDARQGKQGKQQSGPMDASVAVTHGGINTLPPMAVEDPRPDPRPIPVPGATGMDSGREVRWLQDYYDRIYLKKGPDGRDDHTDQFEVKAAWSLPDGRLMLTRTETPNEARIRWQTREPGSNSYHSAIVTNPEHHRQSTAYDLAVGVGSGSKKKWAKEREEDDRAFLKYLCAVGDWRIPELRQDDLLFRLEYYKIEPNSDFKKLMNATIRYFNTGELPYHLLPALADLSPMVVNQTRKDAKVEGQAERSKVARQVLEEGTLITGRPTFPAPKL